MGLNISVVPVYVTNPRARTTLDSAYTIASRGTDQNIELGRAGLVVLAPHLVAVKGKDVGLPHKSKVHIAYTCPLPSVRGS